MTYQVRAIIKDAGCDEFRVLCARDIEFEVVMSLVLSVERREVCTSRGVL